MSLRRLTAVFNDVFVGQNVVLNPEMDARSLKNWDSFNHINLILGIEDEFAVSFSTKEIESIRTVGQLVDALRSKGVSVDW
jgi:acyl carrier protein